MALYKSFKFLDDNHAGMYAGIDVRGCCIDEALLGWMQEFALEGRFLLSFPSLLLPFFPFPYIPLP